MRGGYGISQFMEGTGANLRLPLNPPFFFESAVAYDITTGAGQRRQRLRRADPRHDAVGQRARLRSEPAAAVLAAVERVRRVPGHVDRCRHRSATSVTTPTHLVTPVEGNQALPGIGDPSTWAPKNTRRPLFGALPLVTTIATTAARGGSRHNSLQASVRQRQFHGVEFLASYTLGKTRTNNRGFYGVFGGTGLQGVTSATEGAYWQNTYDPEAEWGPAFHDARHNVTLSGTVAAAVRPGPRYRRGLEPGDRRASLGGWQLGGIIRRAPACRSR